MRKSLLLALTLCAALFAQNARLDIGFAVASPRGEFDEHVNGSGYGLNLGAHFAPVEYFSIGAAGGFFVYGDKTTHRPFSTTIPEVTVEVNTTNNLANFHATMQLIAPVKYVKPYIEGRFGLNYLWTQTSIRDESDSEDIASSTNFDDAALSYGAGAGLYIQLWECPNTRARGNRRGHGSCGAGKAQRVFLDFKALYLRGGTAEYMKEESIYVESGTVYYLVDKSATDLMQYSLGVGIEF